MKKTLILTLGIASLLGFSACVEKQPIDPHYYHQTHAIPYQVGEDSPFTPDEIEQAKRDEEALAKALSDTTGRADTTSWKNELNRICVTEMGFPLGSANYTKCYSFYNDQATAYGINTNTITAAQISAFLLWTNPIISGCRGYGYVGDVLWGCAYRGEHRHHHYWSHHYHHPVHHNPPPHHGGPSHHGKPAHHSQPAPHGHKH